MFSKLTAYDIYITPHSTDYTIVKLPKISKFEKKLINTLNRYHSFICGGYARYILDRSKAVEDIDIYSYSGYVADYLEVDFKIINQLRFADNISNYFIEETPHPLQIIQSSHQGRISKTLESFDLSIAQAAIISDTQAMVSKDFLETLKTNKLKIVNHTKNFNYRCIKYMMRGYDICITDCLKLIGQKDKLNPTEQCKLMGYIKSKEYDKDGLFGELITQGYFELSETAATAENERLEDEED